MPRTRPARRLVTAVVCLGLAALAALAAGASPAVAVSGPSPRDHLGMSPRVAGPAPSVVGTNEQRAFQFFVGKGLTTVQAAGVVGNLDQESGMDPTIQQSGGGVGRGIAQWSVGGRWDTGPNLNVVGYAASSTPARDPYSLDLQLDFVWLELTTYPYLGLAPLRSATTITDAVAAFQDNYERCGDCLTSAREAYARAAYDRYAGSAVPAVVPGAGAVWAGPTGSSYHVFRPAATGHVLHTFFSGTWYQEDLGGSATGAVAVTYAPGRYDLFAVGPSGNLYQNTHTTGWSGWRVIATGFAPGVSAVRTSSGYHVFGHGPSGHLLHAFGTTSFLVEDLGGITTGTPGVTYRPGRYDVFSVSPTNGRLYQLTRTTSWTPFHAIATGPFATGASAGAAAVWTGTQYHLFVTSTSSRVAHVTFAGTWGPPQDLGGTLTGPVAATFHDARYDLFAPGGAGTLTQSTHTAAGGWTAWHRIA